MTPPSDVTIARLLAEGYAARLRGRVTKAGARVLILTVEADQFRTTVEMTDAAWRGLVSRGIVQAPGGRVQLGINGFSRLARLEREQHERDSAA